MSEREPDKLYKREGDSLVMSVIMGKYICTFWFNEPSQFRTMTTDDFQKKLKRERWIQLN